jgi:hypothetical protein
MDLLFFFIGIIIIFLAALFLSGIFFVIFYHILGKKFILYMDWDFFKDKGYYKVDYIRARKFLFALTIISMIIIYYLVHILFTCAFQESLSLWFLVSLLLGTFLGLGIIYIGEYDPGSIDYDGRQYCQTTDEFVRIAIENDKKGEWGPVVGSIIENSLNRKQ